MVVGPSGETVRVGAGLGGTTRERTTLGPLGTASGAGASVVTDAESFNWAGAWAATGCATAGADAGAGVLVTRTGRGASSTGTAGAASTAALVALAAFAAVLAASAGTSRRSPSASARRRMRSAWASSIDADGLEAPMPSFWASASNSLLVNPSSFESSCTRIFFGAKTFPYFVSPHVRRAQFPILSQLRAFTGRETMQHRYF
jgi:hypothetical protein